MAGPIIAKISMDNLIFAPALEKLNTAVDSFCNVTFAKPERTSVSDALAEYENIFLEVENALKLYKQVLEKNAKTIKSINEEISKADSSFGEAGGTTETYSPFALPDLPTIPGVASNQVGPIKGEISGLNNDFSPTINR